MILARLRCVYLCQAFAGWFFLVSFIFVCQARKKVREHGGIQGDACQDCCCTYWCMCCTSAQIFRHLGIGGGAAYPTKYELCTPTGENKPTLLGDP